jgi:lysophospholipase L1-like esterase
MRYLFILLVSIFIYGCGNDNDIAPKRELVKSESVEHSSNQMREGFHRWICVGDSTRAGYGQIVYKDISRSLSKKGVSSKLLAKSGHTLSSFVNGWSYPRLKDLIGSIDEDGRGVIVTISLGINDHSKNTYEIRDMLIYAVGQIRRYRPFTKVILVTPNRLLYDYTQSRKLISAYENAANSSGVSLIYAGWHLSESEYNTDGIHPNSEGQHKIAREILNRLY